MASNIDPTKPVFGSPTTKSVRDNFAAAKSEIETLQQVFSAIKPSIVHMVSLTTGTNQTYTIPEAARVVGANFKFTLIGGGGQGGGVNTTAGSTGAGGGSGGVCVLILPYVEGRNTFTYSVGAGGYSSQTYAIGAKGGDTSITYNKTTYTAGAGYGGNTSAIQGGGGIGGSVTVGNLKITGFQGKNGGISAANNPTNGGGADTPLGFGVGGLIPASSNYGQAGYGYGSGGSGAKIASSGSAQRGGAGAPGLILFEY